MGSVPNRSVQLLASILICGIATAVPVAANDQQEAITATIMGEMVQKVGYRAMIQKQAIMYNLAGYARNDADGTVGVRLQGNKDQSKRHLKQSAPAQRRRQRQTSSGRSRQSWIRI